MISKSQIIKILRTHNEMLSKTYNVKKIGLFGSFVKNFETESSDIDLLVDFTKPITIFEFIDLEDFLTQKMGRKVDLVSEKGLKSLLKPYILGEVIYA
ncbi:MAG: nucleotidyltransferase family protein [Promethearchaeota archaeon]